MTANPLPAPAQLDHLAAVLATVGPAAAEPALARLVAAAREAGLGGPAVDALADPGRAAVLRQRAFARLHAAIVALGSAGGVGPAAAPEPAAA